MTNKITTIALVVSDIRKSIDFYQNKVGFKVSKTDKGYAELASQEVTLELMTKDTLPDKLQVIINSKSQPKAYYSLNPEKGVDIYYQELKEKGVSFIFKPKTMPWGQRVAYFTDPDGNIWEISESTK